MHEFVLYVLQNIRVTNIVVKCHNDVFIRCIGVCLPCECITWMFAISQVKSRSYGNSFKRAINPYVIAGFVGRILCHWTAAPVLLFW